MASTVRIMTVVIDPGPLMNGIAKGIMATLSATLVVGCSRVYDSEIDLFEEIICIEILNRMIPPAILKAERVTPRN